MAASGFNPRLKSLAKSMSYSGIGSCASFLLKKSFLPHEIKFPEMTKTAEKTEN